MFRLLCGPRQGFLLSLSLSLLSLCLSPLPSPLSLFLSHSLVLWWSLCVCRGCCSAEENQEREEMDAEDRAPLIVKDSDGHAAFRVYKSRWLMLVGADLTPHHLSLSFSLALRGICSSMDMLEREKEKRGETEARFGKQICCPMDMRPFSHAFDRRGLLSLSFSLSSFLSISYLAPIQRYGLCLLRPFYHFWALFRWSVFLERARGDRDANPGFSEERTTVPWESEKSIVGP